MGIAIFKIIKGILTIVLLPVVIASALAFHEHLGKLSLNWRYHFELGVAVFLLFCLFVHPCGRLYDFGQKVIREVFKLVEPANRFISFLVPFYIILVFAIFYLSKYFFEIKYVSNNFVFWAGAALCMHIVNTAQLLQEEETGIFKPNYIFSIVVIFIVTLLFTVGLFDILIKKVTFPKYINSLWATSQQMYHYFISWIIR